MLNLKKITPIGSQVLVTKNLYEWDDFNEMGLVVHQRGEIKSYQTVLAVGSDVKFVKVGDVVEINYYKYVILKDDQNSVKAISDNNSIIDLRLNEVDLVDDRGNPYTAFLIDQRDVKYIMEDYEDVKVSANPLIVDKSNQIIVPSGFRV